MMKPTMHAKTDSDTSIDDAYPPRRPMYYVESPSLPEMEKLSLHSGQIDSSPPPNHQYRPSTIHHSRESSGSRFSTALSPKHPYASGWGYGKNIAGWNRMRRMVHGGQKEEEDDGAFVDDYERDPNRKLRFACYLLIGFLIMFLIISLSLWGASKSRRPRVAVQYVMFQRFDVQAGLDESGVETDMLSLNSTVAINYVNRGTFFGIHVSSSPWELYCYQLKVASGEMEEFDQGRKSEQLVETIVNGHQVPVYGAISGISTNGASDKKKFSLPLNLTLSVNSKAYVLGKLVRSRFYNYIRCPVTLRGDQLGKKLNVASCVYQ